MPNTPDEVAPYPPAWEVNVVAADGGTVHLRPIVPADAPALKALSERWSRESLYYRFFSYRKEIPDKELTRLATVDYHDRMALVAELGDEIIAVGRYDLLAPRMAEVAFLVEDGHQRRGLGTLLLRAPCRARPPERDRPLHGLHAAGQPPDARGLPQRRVPDRGPHGGRHLAHRVPHRSPRCCAVARPGTAGRGGVDRPHPGAVVGCGHRHVASCGESRSPGAAQPLGRRVLRHGASRPPRPSASPVCRPTRRSPTSATQSISPSSRFPPPRSLRSWRTVPQPASVPW